MYIFIFTVDINCTNKRGMEYQGKQHFCMYCQTLHFKLARHLEAKHHIEKEMQEVLKYKKGLYL